MNLPLEKELGELYSNGNKKYDYSYDEIEKTDHVSSYNENGTKNSDRNFKNGYCISSINYNKYGIIISEISYNNSMQYGPYKYYYDDGKIRKVGIYCGSEKIQTNFIEYFQNGNIKEERKEIDCKNNIYRDDISSCIKYYENGIMREKYNYYAYPKMDLYMNTLTYHEKLEDFYAKYNKKSVLIKRINFEYTLKKCHDYYENGYNKNVKHFYTYTRQNILTYNTVVYKNKKILFY